MQQDENVENTGIENDKIQQIRTDLKDQLEDMDKYRKIL